MTHVTLEQLLANARAAVEARQRAKAKVQQAASVRLREVGLLEWPLDDRRYWQPFAARHIYERQVCDCCQGETMTFHQELVGFQHTKLRDCRRWLRYRGEALSGDLPTETEVIETLVPRCWDCQTVDRLLRTLWHK